jgi:hypothetical protein
MSAKYRAWLAVFACSAIFWLLMVTAIYLAVKH